MSYKTHYARRHSGESPIELRQEHGFVKEAITDSV